MGLWECHEKVWGWRKTTTFKGKDPYLRPTPDPVFFPYLLFVPKTLIAVFYPLPTSWIQHLQPHGNTLDEDASLGCSSNLQRIRQL